MSSPSKADVRPRGYGVSASALLGFCVFATVFTSGGLILSASTVSARLLSSGLLQPDDCNEMFNLAYQLLGWLSVVWLGLEPSIGPRWCAAIGLLVAVGGNVMLAVALAVRCTSGALYGLGLGLVGGGGNGLYLMCFHVAPPLFAERRQGLVVGVLNGAFQASTLVYLLLNEHAIGMGSFFAAYATLTLAVSLATLAAFPDTAYAQGASASLTAPRCACCTRGGNGACQLCASVWRELCRALSLAAPSLRLGLFWSYALAFSWTQATHAWLQGVGASQLYWPSASAAFYEWGQPLTYSALSIVCSPLAGALIDGVGIRTEVCVLLGLSMGGILCAWLAGRCLADGHECLAWPTVVLTALVPAFLFPLEFAYLLKTFPPRAFTGLLLTVIMTSNLVGFVNWPFLDLAKPFGQEPSQGNALFFLIPTALSAVWPLWWLTLRPGPKHALDDEGEPPTREPPTREPPTREPPTRELPKGAIAVHIAQSQGPDATEGSWTRRTESHATSARVSECVSVL